MKKLSFILQVTGLFFFCLAGIAAAQKCVSGDCKNGVGKYVYSNGDTYEGNFVNGKKDGFGTFVFASGEKYVGPYKAGERHGYGLYVYDNGDIYQGDYVDGVKHGKGTYTFADGDYYEGEYLNGERHGTGKMYSKETNTFKVGIWKEGKYVPGSGPVAQAAPTKLSEGELWKKQVAYAEDIEGRAAKIKTLSLAYSTKLSPAQKRDNLEARKAENIAINGIASKALDELGDQVKPDSEQFFVTKKTDSMNGIKAIDALLDIIAMNEKQAKTASGTSFLDQTLTKPTPTPKSATGGTSFLDQTLTKPKPKPKPTPTPAASGGSFLDENFSWNAPTQKPATASVAASGASANPNNEGRELFGAVATNNTDLALELIRKGANVHYRSWSNPPEMSERYKYLSLNTLGAAARNKNLVLAKALLDAGADPNARMNISQETALFNATQIKMPEMVELFLRYKADPNVRDESDRTPLHSAAAWEAGDAVVKMLLAAGANPNVYTTTGKSPLAYAQEGTDKATVNTLYAASNPEIRNNPRTTNIPTSPLGTFSFAPPVYNRKPRAANAEELAGELWNAVRAHNTSEVIRLVNAGAEVNWRKGDTPILKEAVDTYDIQMVQALLEAGADPNMGDLQYGMSALHEAVSYVNIDMVKLLLRYKGDPNVTTKNGRTAIHVAAQWNTSDKILAVLIDAGGNPNAIDAENRTAKSMALGQKWYQLSNLIDKALAQKTYAPGVRVASQMPEPTESTSNNYARDAAMREYEIVHGRVEENLQRYINNYNKYAKMDPRFRSMMRETVNTMNQAKSGALSMIDELLKKHGNNLPKDVRDHLREDAGKFISLPM